MFIVAMWREEGGILVHVTHHHVVQSYLARAQIRSLATYKFSQRTKHTISLIWRLCVPSLVSDTLFV